jgi:hypothetical protein
MIQSMIFIVFKERNSSEKLFKSGKLEVFRYFYQRLKCSVLGVVRGGFWEMESKSLVLGHIVLNFQETCTNTLGDMIF